MVIHRILLGGWLLAGACVARAQQVEPLPPVNREALYRAGIQHLDRFYHDSALYYFQQLIDHLALTQELDTPFGLEVQLRKGETLEKYDQDAAALPLLLRVSEQAESQQQWEVLVNAELSLARLHEKLDFPENCRAALEKARRTIQRQRMDDLQPRLSVRLASYHRVFESRDSARLYAQYVLDNAPRFGQHDLLANGYLLMGLLTRDSVWQDGVFYFREAGYIWKQIGNYSAVSSMYLNIARLQYKHGWPAQALAHSDSSMVNFYQAEAMGYREKSLLWTNYQLRAQIFRDGGQQDSAWHYLNSGYDMQLQDVYLANAREIAKITTQYEDEQKGITIAEQSARLEVEARQRKLWLALFFGAFVSAGALLYLYLRLRSSNEQLGKALDYQVMLQGEVHHRVKNNMQVIIGLLELQKEGLTHPDDRANIDNLVRRIFSMAAIHDTLYRQDTPDAVPLDVYIQKLCDHIQVTMPLGQPPVISLDIQTPALSLETMVPLGIVLNELLVNSVKHFGQGAGVLHIDISLVPAANQYLLTYRDNGPGFSQGTLQSREGSLGTFLLLSMARQLGGELNSYNLNGAVVEVTFGESAWVSL